MKRFLFLLLIAPVICFSQDVRKARWGMTKDSVRKVETAKPYPALNEADQLAFEGKVDGDDFVILYMFSSNKLKTVTLLYDEEHSSAETFYEQFLRISDKLDGKYGQHEDRTIWKSTLYKDDQERYGFAASYGHVRFIHSWKTDRTVITIVLHGDNFKCSLGLVYSDINNQEKKETEF